MGYVPEEPHLYAHLSGLEYLTMVGQLRGLPAKRTAERIDGLLRLLVAPRRPPLAHLGLFERHAPEDPARRRRCCTIPIFCCSTSLFPGWTFPPRWCCAA